MRLLSEHELSEAQFEIKSVCQKQAEVTREETAKEIFGEIKAKREVCCDEDFFIMSFEDYLRLEARYIKEANPCKTMNNQT